MKREEFDENEVEWVQFGPYDVVFDDKYRVARGSGPGLNHQRRHFCIFNFVVQSLCPAGLRGCRPRSEVISG
jgi:hypothetical protein